MDFFVELNKFLDAFPITLIELTDTQDRLTLPTENLLAIPQDALRKAYPVVSKRFVLLLSHEPTAERQEELLQLSRLLLIQNPDHLTALSTRRKILVKPPNNRLAKELALTKLLLSITSHAKSSALWFHRRWVLHRLFPPCRSEATSGAEPRLPANLPVEEMDQELEFSLQACDAYPRNYYAWSHRQWALDQLLQDASLASRDHLLANERQRLRAFIRLHPRDHSAVHYLASFLRASSSFSSQKQFILDCYAVLAEYPHYEAGWALLKAVSLANTNNTSPHSVALLDASSTTSQLLRSLASNPSLPFSYSSSPAATPNTTTLAQQHSLNLRRSLILCLRTLYLLGCHFGWIHWSEQTALLLLHPPASPTDSSKSSLSVPCPPPASIQALQELVQKFILNP